MLRHVEKLRVPVRVALVGHAAVEGFLSLSPHAELHDGPETLLERLNEGHRVIPFHRASDGAILLLSRHQVDWVAAGPQVAPMLLRPQSYLHTREERVRLRLVGGETIDGLLGIEMPTEYNRTSDFLNGDEDFFALSTTDGTRIVSKLRLIDVHLLGGESLPLPWPHAA